jgi:hypothetical protein
MIACILPHVIGSLWSLIVGFADRLQATDYRLQCENLAWLSL